MIITKAIVTPVNVPLEAPIRWPWGCRTDTTRIIIQLETNDGIVGVGETMGNDAVLPLVQSASKSFVGESPFNLERILSKVQRMSYFSGYSGYAAIAALEMACWDILGKFLDRPVYDLMGGLYKKRVDFSAYVFFRYRSETGLGGEETPEQVLEFCRDLSKKNGFKVFKFKAGVLTPDTEIETIRALRTGLQSDVQLRIDANGVWKPSTALRICKRLEEFDLEYIEDPTWGLEAMGRLRREIRTPFATNMCVVELDHIPLNVRFGAADVILGDCHKWGGFLATKKLAAVCEAFGFGMSMHSGAELGISTAANMHLVASTPLITYAIDSHYHHLTDDIIVGGKMEYQNGSMDVPSGPGLGIRIDSEKLGLYAERYQKNGEKPFVSDSRRPNWIPERFLW